ncbi:aminotransferase class I/II-fold pyridoxal phosphate-dependent enzyme [Halarcobacter ebronensis]|uniref:Aminotransferase class I/II n=1 Tax=Halarcobacter ebronensis TaxID=1462615 RepID=A0A4Q1ARR5_9BACT|nr:aminotransferase class I/II-fold pyridoxal phosphate-dependent enzyme [Halarcobacter ebronensis]QKF82161.1 L-threonine-O-3-phosphate decarboxylase [Halarcobacter ebronensis]RXK03460.1 aminotransferase class I/II [Halarcobacter ebronensis]
MKEFQHGGDIDSFVKELKCKKEEIIDLSSNINFLKPKLNIDFNKVDISFYANYEKLYKTVAKHYKVKKSNLELFNGASRAIFSLFDSLGLKECFIYSPAYLEYKKAAKLFGYKINLINRFENLKKEIKKGSLVIFANPSTPEGTFYKLEELFQVWAKNECTILIDESFLEFTKESSAIRFLKEYKKLYILKSMTKFYSCAGVRVGTIISDKKNIKQLKEKEPKWKLSTFDMNYIIEALKDKTFVSNSLEQNSKNKELLKSILNNYSFIEKVYESDANFLLLKLKNIDAKTMQKHLKKYKIMIRDCSNFDFLDSTFVRVAIKDKSSILKLKKALDRI